MRFTCFFVKSSCNTISTQTHLLQSLRLPWSCIWYDESVICIKAGLKGTFGGLCAGRLGLDAWLHSGSSRHKTILPWYQCLAEAMLRHGWKVSPHELFIALFHFSLSDLSLAVVYYFSLIFHFSCLLCSVHWFAHFLIVFSDRWLGLMLVFILSFWDLILKLNPTDALFCAYLELDS